VVSKSQIAFESKAQADAKAQHTFEYVSILKRPATQLSGDRWDFKTTSGSSVAVGIACRVRQINEKAKIRLKRSSITYLKNSRSRSRVPFPGGISLLILITLCAQQTPADEKVQSAILSGG